MSHGQVRWGSPIRQMSPPREHDRTEIRGRSEPDQRVTGPMGQEPGAQQGAYERTLCRRGRAKVLVISVAADDLETWMPPTNTGAPD
jgi:hypothetical protein